MRRIRLVMLIVMSMPPVSGIAMGNDVAAPGGDVIVAKVGNVAIHNSEVEAVIDSFIPQGGFHGGVSREKRGEYRPRALEFLIEKELFHQEALRRGLKADEEEINNLIEANIKRFPSKKAFEKEIRAKGLSDERFRELVVREILISKVIADEITKKSIYTDEELSSYYEKNIDKFKRPEAIRVWHILISVSPSSTEEEKAKSKARAEEVYRKVKNGGDFVILAEQYSDDAYRIKGGDLGYIHRGRLEPELEVVAFQLKEEEISPIVETIYGFHIIKAGGRKPPETIPFEETKKKLKSELETRKISELRAGFVTSLKERITVEIF
jgi:parvulin-like peptidyl-prolyl isomerase